MTNIYQNNNSSAIDYFSSIFTIPLEMNSFDSISFYFDNVINIDLDYIFLNYIYSSNNKWLLYFEEHILYKKTIFNSDHTKHLNFLSTIFLTINKLSTL